MRKMLFLVENRNHVWRDFSWLVDIEFGVWFDSKAVG